MYDQYFGFSEEPFRLSPDHGFAYEHKAYSKARAYMAYALLRAEGFVMVTGRPGTGKTTLVGALVDQLASENVKTANLVCTQLGADDLLRVVADEFGVAAAAAGKGELLQSLTRCFKAWHRDGQRALLIVDEAQDLSAPAMEELRLLTNIQVGGQPLLQIFLLGQPGLRELILSPQLEQVHQRIVAASHLRPLEAEETEAYVRHRLERVGWRGDPAISKAVYPLVYKFSEGIPRRINLICSRLFLHCAVEQRHAVEVADLRTVIEELQGENLAAGGAFTARDFRVQDSFEPARETAAPPSVGASGEGASGADDRAPSGGGRDTPSASLAGEVIRSPLPAEARDEEESGGQGLGSAAAAAGGARVVSMPVRRAPLSPASARRSAPAGEPAVRERPPAVVPVRREAAGAPEAARRTAPGGAPRPDHSLAMAALLVGASVGLVAWAANGFRLPF